MSLRYTKHIWAVLIRKKAMQEYLHKTIDKSLTRILIDKSLYLEAFEQIQAENKKVGVFINTLTYSSDVFADVINVNLLNLQEYYVMFYDKYDLFPDWEKAHAE
jgi:alanine dehydrogenase